MVENNIPHHIMDGNPDIHELTNHAKTANWNDLGIELKIDKVILAGCHTCAEMYQKWLATKTKRETTRRKLIAALKKINEERLAEEYMEYLTTMVSLNN